ncbi:cytochrome c oxidase subunit 6A1, mitochondrial [Nomia melanderi]|uniref:cytochrome c oxidase subunit 6A1, mitochondrial n=1 Tax=Nomia melanderi TaxID=2448451 RepID=UPI003FCC29DF
MSRIRNLGQFGQMFTRNLVTVKTVEQLSHRPSEGTLKLWRFMTLFVGAPCLVLCMINCYINSLNEHHERPPPLEMPYLKIMRKPFPWGDGKHSLFHNPKTNWIPGVGYEE